MIYAEKQKEMIIELEKRIIHFLILSTWLWYGDSSFRTQYAACCQICQWQVKGFRCSWLIFLGKEQLGNARIGGTLCTLHSFRHCLKVQHNSFITCIARGKNSYFYCLFSYLFIPPLAGIGIQASFRYCENIIIRRMVLTDNRSSGEWSWQITDRQENGPDR